MFEIKNPLNAFLSRLYIAEFEIKQRKKMMQREIENTIIEL